MIPKLDAGFSDLEELFAQIITISEIFQPSEDDIAERILSQNSDPFNVNFDMDDGKFKVDFDLIPDDERSQFVAN